MTEAEFITVVSIVAENHNCRIKEIDFEARTFQIACPKGNDVMCAAELEEVLKAYCMDEPENFMGWVI